MSQCVCLAPSELEAVSELLQRAAPSTTLQDPGTEWLSVSTGRVGYGPVLDWHCALTMRW